MSALYGTRHYDLLLANMLRSQGILQLAATSLQATFFTDPRIGGTPTQAVIFQAIVAFYQAYGHAPDRSILQVEVVSIMDRCLGPDPGMRAAVAAELHAFFAFAAIVGDESLQLTRDLVTHMTKTCVYNDRVSASLSEALQTGEYEGLEAKLAMFSNEQLGVQGGLTTSGLGTSPTTEGEQAPRSKFYIGFLDELFQDGKGPTTGCGIALIASQGCGKTTCGIQMAVSACLAGNNAVLILAEEGLTASVRRNIRASATGIPTTIQETMQDDWVKAAESANLDAGIVKTKLELIDKHLQVLDLIEHPMSLDQIEGELQRLVMMGKRPSLVYTDWAGMLADYLMNNTPKGGRKFDSKEAAVKYVGDRVAAWGPKFGCLSVISQQMAGKWTIKGPMYEYSYNCAADCSLFTQSMKYVMVLGPRHETSGLQYLRLPKARNDKPGQTVMIRLIGEKATIVRAEGYERRGKTFQKIQTGAAGLPKEDADAFA